MMLEKIKEPFNLIIFGASGDLANLKIFPALYELANQKRFQTDFRIYGYARTEMTEGEFRKKFKESVKKHTEPSLFNQKILDELASHLHYFSGLYDNSADYKKFADLLLKAHNGHHVRNVAFFAVPPLAYKEIAKNMGQLKEKLGGNMQLMIEKPFGENRDTANELLQFITNYFEKKNLFLIDHYLGKAAVKSILPLRYNNTILNLLLKGSEVSNIQISALETAGVDERVGFFDNVGIIKDMVQSHLLQILALLTMNMPIRREVHSIRREKGDILSSLRYPSDQCAMVVGQYKSYKKIKGVKKNSSTPTFVALRCLIDLTNWYQVPVYIRAGKKLSHKHTYIVIEFKKPPYAQGLEIEANRLIIELHPYERIQIRLVNDQGKLAPKYNDLISEESLACMGDDCLSPYAGLILDGFLKREESFLSIDEILSSWHFVDSLNDCMKEHSIKLNQYEDDGDGPKEQNDLPSLDNHQWYDPDPV